MTKNNSLHFLKKWHKFFRRTQINQQQRFDKIEDMGDHIQNDLGLSHRSQHHGHDFKIHREVQLANWR